VERIRWYLKPRRPPKKLKEKLTIQQTLQVIDQKTLQRQTTLSLADWAEEFSALHPQAKLSARNLSQIYKSFGIKKRKVAKTAGGLLRIGEEYKKHLVLGIQKELNDLEEKSTEVF
jgi:hypothetical protein